MRAQLGLLPSSRKVNRPIWGNSLKVSRQMVPAVRRRAMQTWSCFTNRGRVLLFSPVFLSTIQIKACQGDKQHRRRHTHRALDLDLEATQQMYLGNRDLPRFAPPQCRCECEALRCNLDRWWICVRWWRSVGGEYPVLMWAQKSIDSTLNMPNQQG